MGDDSLFIHQFWTFFINRCLIGNSAYLNSMSDLEEGAHNTQCSFNSTRYARPSVNSENKNKNKWMTTTTLDLIKESYAQHQEFSAEHMMLNKKLDMNSSNLKVNGSTSSVQGVKICKIQM